MPEEPVDPGPVGSSRTLRLPVVVTFVTMIALAGLVYASSRLATAAGKPLWLDEYHALKASVRAPSVLHSLFRGAPGQGSPSPLDYLLLKALDNGRYTVGFFGLPPLSYYRLVSILAILLSGIAVSVGSFRRFAGSNHWLNLAWMAVLLSCLTAFWFQPNALEYSTQMRPYALWLALSFLVYAAAPLSSRWWLMAAWLGVAATSTAALYQIATMAAAYLTVGALRGRTLRATAAESLAVLAVPFMAAGYYAFRAGKWDYRGPEWGTWSVFAEFWGACAWVAVLSGAGVAVCLARRDTRKFAVPCLAMLFLYLVAPAIYFLTRQRGFFFTPRQYIYYELAGPLFMLTAARCLATWVNDRPRRGRAIAGVFIVFTIACSVLTQRLVLGAPGHAWKAARASPWPSFPADPAGAVARSMSGGFLPAGYCLVGRKASEGIVRNLELVADWLQVRNSKPIGEEIVDVMPDGDGARVIAVRTGNCASDRFVGLVGRAN